MCMCTYLSIRIYVSVFLQAQVNECIGSSNDKSKSMPVVIKSTTPPVIIISDEEVKDIPEPFPFPVTYSANVDAALHRGKKLKLLLSMIKSYINNTHVYINNTHVYIEEECTTPI